MSPNGPTLPSREASHRAVGRANARPRPLVLAAVDLGPASRPVVSAAVRLARRSVGRLLLLHAVPPDPVELRGPEPARRMIQGMLAVIHRRERARLRALAAATGLPRGRVAWKFLPGDPAEVILAAARAHRPACIVVAGRRHGAVFDLFVGSTAQRVLRRATCPVLVVPARGT
jgi:nucleotide-binding universal stress UspA family protein